VKKFLIIRFSSIGDIVLTTPVIRCLKEQNPGCEIHYITKRQYHSILRDNPYLSKVHLFEKSFSEVIPALKAERFDFIIDLHKNLRSAYILLNLRRPFGTFSKLNLRKWLRVKLHINLLPDIHIVDRYFRAVRKTGAINDGKGLDYFISDEDHVQPASLPLTHRESFIALVIGGKHNTKIYPASLAAEVCKRSPLPVILLGGPEDRERGEMIASSAGEKVFNGCGIWTINQSASVISKAHTVITNDTGMMHIAAAYKRPVISIWGNTIPAFGMYPYLPKDKQELSKIIEVNGLGCRPCSKLGYETCPKGHFKCMKLIEPQEIINAI